MHRDREAVAHAGLVDRMVEAAAEGTRRAAAKHDRADPGMRAEPIDRGRRPRRVLRVDVQGEAEPRIVSEPVPNPEAVERAADGAGELAGTAGQEGELDIQLVEQPGAESKTADVCRKHGEHRDDLRLEGQTGRDEGLGCTG